MSPLFAFSAAILAVAQVALPRKLAFLPLIVAGCHLGNVEILPQLTTARLLILIGLVRAAASGDLAFSPRSCVLDRWMLIFAAFLVFSTIGHSPDPYVPSPLNARLGLVLNCVGSYLYGRAFIRGVDDLRRYAVLLPLILLPLAVAMSHENRTQRNLYFKLGARSDTAMQREDRIRAQGPFQHPILAGTAGATALPFAYLLWRQKRRKLAILGGAACFGVVLASASSGPLAALAVTFGAIALWPFRRMLPALMISGVLLALVYSAIKGKGPWYLMASIDLVGGSTGWHRAYLIDQGLKHFNEWWLWGSDYTRHWIASGVRWNPNHIDVTNYYLHMGVTGGVVVVISLIALIVSGFRLLYRAIKNLRAAGDELEIVPWCVGAAITAHAISFISISYFDQMYIFFYVLIGFVPALVVELEARSRERGTTDYELQVPLTTQGRSYNTGY